ncbi:MAG TPA: hypothetical protein VMZ91_13880, partial [Candidatus Paceibacterota bacterium]|nr:hypothetical protein [Candidatus Paceibacterota bacterium]
SRRFEFLITTEKLICEIGEKNRTIVINESNVEIRGDTCKSTFIAGIDNVFNNIDGEVFIYMTNDAPMIIRKTTNNYEAVYLIAPVCEIED